MFHSYCEDDSILYFVNFIVKPFVDYMSDSFSCNMLLNHANTFILQFYAKVGNTDTSTLKSFIKLLLRCELWGFKTK